MFSLMTPRRKSTKTSMTFCRGPGASFRKLRDAQKKKREQNRKTTTVIATWSGIQPRSSPCSPRGATPARWKPKRSTPFFHHAGAPSTGPRIRVRSALKIPKKTECSWCTSPFPPSAGRARPLPTLARLTEDPVDHRRGDDRRETSEKPRDVGRKRLNGRPEGGPEQGVPENGLEPEFPVDSSWRTSLGRREATEEIRQPERRDDSHGGPQSQGEGGPETARRGGRGGREQGQCDRRPEQGPPGPLSGFAPLSRGHCPAPCRPGRGPRTRGRSAGGPPRAPRFRGRPSGRDTVRRSGRAPTRAPRPRRSRRAGPTRT